MQIWTTFCPRKVCWELSYISTNEKSPTSQWLENVTIIRHSLKTLRENGISGIRLVIFPYEIVNNEIYNFKPIDTILQICQQLGIKVDLCLGPFQYPYHPGIRLPNYYLAKIKQSQSQLDRYETIRQFGVDFLEKQLSRYGKDERIRGFYLANEWPDKQRIEGKEKIIASISREFMLEAVQIIKKHTKKPIILNTSINASLWPKILWTYKDIFKILGKQGKLGLDLYPSQENWLHKLLYLVFPYTFSVNLLKRVLSPSQIIFSELEGQPWGSGKPWFYYVKHASDPNNKILTFSRHSLSETLRKYIKLTGINEVSLWGSDFWLACQALGFTWPLEQIKETTDWRKE